MKTLYIAIMMSIIFMGCTHKPLVNTKNCEIEECTDWEYFHARDYICKWHTYIQYKNLTLQVLDSEGQSIPKDMVVSEDVYNELKEHYKCTEP